MTDHENDEPIRALAPRLAQIADGIGDGLTAKAIAHRLGLSVKTVKNRTYEIATLFTRQPGDTRRPRDVIRDWVRRKRAEE